MHPFPLEITFLIAAPLTYNNPDLLQGDTEPDAPDWMFETDLTDILKKYHKPGFQPNTKPVQIKCGPVPANASANCQPKQVNVHVNFYLSFPN